MTNAPAPTQEISVADVIFVLGQKELELQYARGRIERLSQRIEELQTELAKLREGT